MSNQVVSETTGEWGIQFDEGTMDDGQPSEKCFATFIYHSARATQKAWVPDRAKRKYRLSLDVTSGRRALGAY